MCDETMKNASSTCQVIHYNGSTVVQDFLISQLNIKPNDRFFTGLSRDNCNSPWLWRNFDNTTSPFVSSLISLPETNVDCDLNVQGYASGSLDPVSAQTFNATSFICECCKLHT
uniref:Uncharacterized protein n=1 Tax=Panagrolaimus davidi TaxID=227884 RepID=A0A914PPS2_9BILA